MRGFLVLGCLLSAASLGGCADELALPESHVTAEAPLGFVSFCLRFADQCASGTNAAPIIVLTRRSSMEIDNVNRTVNHGIVPLADKTHYDRYEYWTIPSDGFGDCEDYVLAKRRDLIQAGFPAAALRIAVVKTKAGEGHAVLTVSTNWGDFVLDNLSDEIRNWRDLPYRWVARQNGADMWRWDSLEAINPPAAVAATSGEQD